MKTQALVVVDMQGGFAAAKDKETIKQVLVAIEEAKAANMPIIILELSKGCFGKTIDCIIEAVDLYDNVYFVDKSRNDGGREVEETVEANEFQISEFVVCGVNITFCVAETISTLVNEYDESVIVLQSACHCQKILDGMFDDRDDAFSHNGIYDNAQVTMAGYPEIE